MFNYNLVFSMFIIPLFLLTVLLVLQFLVTFHVSCRQKFDSATKRIMKGMDQYGM